MQLNQCTITKYYLFMVVDALMLNIISTIYAVIMCNVIEIESNYDIPL